MHVRNMRARGLAPRFHRMRVLPGVALDRRRRTTIRVALAQDGIYRAAKRLPVALPERFVIIGLWVIREIREPESLGLQLGDSGLELRHRGADVGQFDDVGVRELRQAAEFTEIVGDFLLVVEIVGEFRKNAGRQRDVARRDFNARRRRERANNRQ